MGVGRGRGNGGEIGEEEEEEEAIADRGQKRGRNFNPASPAQIRLKMLLKETRLGLQSSSTGRPSTWPKKLINGTRHYPKRPSMGLDLE